MGSGSRRSGVMRRIRIGGGRGFDPASRRTRNGDECRQASTPCRRYSEHAVKGLAIKEVAERTGLAAGTIRMWEQRYGVPVPARTPAGYRLYSDEDVEMLRRAVALRERGLSVPAALDRARSLGTPTD